MGAAEEKGFDGDAFYRALEATVKAKSTTWKQVAEQTGVSASTLTRMAQGQTSGCSQPSCPFSLGTSEPLGFCSMAHKATRPEPIAQISTLLWSDPNLDAGSAEALDAIVRAAYERFRRIEK